MRGPLAWMGQYLGSLPHTRTETRGDARSARAASIGIRRVVPAPATRDDLSRMPYAVLLAAITINRETQNFVFVMRI
jgi:hypothetical protein